MPIELIKARNILYGIMQMQVNELQVCGPIMKCAISLLLVSPNINTEIMTVSNRFLEQSPHLPLVCWILYCA